MPEVWELQMLLAKQSEHEANKNIFFFMLCKHLQIDTYINEFNIYEFLLTQI